MQAFADSGGESAADVSQLVLLDLLVQVSEGRVAA